MSHLVPKCVSDQSALPMMSHRRYFDQIKDCGWFKRMRSINVGSLKCAPKPTPAPVPSPVPVPSNPAPVPSPVNPPAVPQPDKGRSTESSLITCF